MYLEGGQAFIGTVKLQTNMCAVCMWEILDYVMEGQNESLECHLSSTTERYCGHSASWWWNACSAPTWWFEGYLDVASSTTYEGLADGDVIMCCRLHPKCIQLYNIHQTVCVELFVPNQTNTPVLLTFRYLVLMPMWSFPSTSIEKYCAPLYSDLLLLDTFYTHARGSYWSSWCLVNF